MAGLAEALYVPLDQNSFLLLTSCPPLFHTLSKRSTSMAYGSLILTEYS